MDTTPARIEDVQLELRQILVDEFLAPGEGHDRLGADTRLVTDRVLGHVELLALVGILERRYGIEFSARDLDPVDFDRFSQIAETVVRKSACRPAPAVHTAPEPSPVPWWAIGRLAQRFG
jgi:hypothetical protein